MGCLETLHPQVAHLNRPMLEMEGTGAFTNQKVTSMSLPVRKGGFASFLWRAECEIKKRSIQG
jgi:hypothetical protein